VIANAPSARDVAVAADPGILYLDQDAVRRASRELDPAAVVADALRLHAQGRTILPDEAYLGWTAPLGGPARSLNMPSYIDGDRRVAGTKIINGNPANVSRGLPRASGLTLLFDVETAQIVCVMDAAYISALRTACVTAVCATRLGRHPLERAAVIGAGALAAAHLETLPRYLPDVAVVAVYDSEPARSRQLLERYGDALQREGVSLRIAPSAREAIAGARLVVPVTTTRTAYIERDWLDQGALIVNVSLDDVTEEVVLSCDRLVVDDWKLVREDERRLLGRMYRAGLVTGPDELRSTARRVDAELGEIVAGTRPGRLRDDELILVNPFGLSIEDIAVAAAVYDVARRTGLGQQLDR
jgi:ornithine cyclodeaminase/alanine dehydrogenase-like protein (mu-crystallin family)